MRTFLVFAFLSLSFPLSASNFCHPKEISDTTFKANHASEINYLRDQITTYQDFPKPGIVFQDIIPLLGNETSFGICVDLFYEYYKSKEIEAVVGLESRGFIFGAALAYKLGVAFVPVRKAGKIPGPSFSVHYAKEYGTDTLCIPQNAIRLNQRTLIVDDLIATGGSAKAAIELVRLAGGDPVAFASLLEIKSLNGKDKLGIPCFNLVD